MLAEGRDELTLRRGKTKYGLPLRGKSYVMRSNAVTEYLGWAKVSSIEEVNLELGEADL